MKKQYMIEIEESKAETVVNLLAQISVTINNPPKEERKKVKLWDSYDNDMEPAYLDLTEEQYNLLMWLAENDWLYENICIDKNPIITFEKI